MLRGNTMLAYCVERWKKHYAMLYVNTSPDCITNVYQIYLSVGNMEALRHVEKLVMQLLMYTTLHPAVHLVHDAGLIITL